MKAIITATRTGVRSHLAHIQVVCGPQVTTILCDRCGASHREPWPGLVDHLERWAQVHRHEADARGLTH